MELNYKSGLVLLVIIALVTASGLSAQAMQTGSEVVEVEGQEVEAEWEGEQDWQQGVIRVTGEGVAPEDAAHEAHARLLAQRAARAVAYRNAVEYIEGVRVDSQTEVEDMMLESDEIDTQVNGYVNQARVVDREHEFGIARVTIEVPLNAQNGDEGLTSFLEGSVEENSSDERAEDIDDYLEGGARDEPTEEPDRLEPEQPPTGIVIDARGHQVEPALYPQIFDADGYPIYGPTLASADAHESSSLVAYARNQEQAMEIDRLGENPILVEAVSAIDRSGEAATDLILDSETAEKFSELDDREGIINRRAVVFLID